MRQSSVCPFGHSSQQEIRTINLQDKCVHKNKTLQPSNTLVSQLSFKQRKQEYYFLLLQFLPEVVTILKRFQLDFPFGLVKYEDSDSKIIVSGVDYNFLNRITSATENEDFLTASYWAHNIIGVTTDIATEVWAKEANWEEPALTRLLELVDDHRQKIHGKLAAQKRIASAMLQTMHISASLERFTYGFFVEKYERSPTSLEIMQLHVNNMKIAMYFTELHLERTRKVRPVLGAETLEDGIVHRYIENEGFFLTEEGIEIKPGVLAKKMKQEPIDSTDGRIGCPGSTHIPFLWKWICDVSKQYSYNKIS